MSDTRVLVLVGSLRADSHNRRLAQAIVDNAPAGVDVTIAEGLGELPFYNEDIDGEKVPALVASFRDQVAAADRVLVVTPEYNGTMPAVVNNALDWASRPFGAGAIKDKPLAVIGTSVGQHGGKWAHDDTRRSAKVAGASVLDEVELHHRYEWGSDPVADAATVAEFLTAVEKLAAHEGVAA